MRSIFKYLIDRFRELFTLKFKTFVQFPKNRLFLFLLLYPISVGFIIIGFVVVEGWNIVDSASWTLLNVVTFGGSEPPIPLSRMGLLYTIFAKLFSMFCIGGIFYSALQTTIFARVDKMAEERMRNAQQKPINIFLSYRRNDSAGFAGRIFDRVSSFFGTPHVFMDVNAIAPGQDFKAIIESSVENCDVFLLIMGPNWIGKKENEIRIKNVGDFVRIEVEKALKEGIDIIPVLVDEAELPEVNDLPDSLKPILSYHIIRLDNARWNHDVQKLIDAVDTIRNGK